MAEQNVESNNNTKYISIREILHRVEKYDVSMSECVQWCAQCLVEEIREISDWFLFKNIERSTDSDGRALIPCNLYRLLNLKDSSKNRMYGYYNNGTYIISKQHANSKVYFDYYGIPIDKDMRPLVVKGSEKACEYFCIMKAKEAAFFDGKVTQLAWNHIMESLGDGINKARNSFKNISRDDMHEILMINYNMITNVGQYPMNLD